ncbi:heat shock protein [Anaeramoeba flamelloides]|uniref:Heat shock protein n=1 Tax=Anaeramoeba flamelloides TaxID=1746091 RepID=A0AAV7Z5W1_9EUKA|nr:heat shock protein [Anaeramoeba flamelloides]
MTTTLDLKSFYVKKTDFANENWSVPKLSIPQEDPETEIVRKKTEIDPTISRVVNYYASGFATFSVEIRSNTSNLFSSRGVINLKPSYFTILEDVQISDSNTQKFNWSPEPELQIYRESKETNVVTIKIFDHSKEKTRIKEIQYDKPILNKEKPNFKLFKLTAGDLQNAIILEKTLCMYQWYCGKSPERAPFHGHILNPPSGEIESICGRAVGTGNAEFSSKVSILSTANDSKVLIQKTPSVITFSSNYLTIRISNRERTSFVLHWDKEKIKILPFSQIDNKKLSSYGFQKKNLRNLLVLSLKINTKTVKKNFNGIDREKEIEIIKEEEEEEEEHGQEEEQEILLICQLSSKEQSWIFRGCLIGFLSNSNLISKNNINKKVKKTNNAAKNQLLKNQFFLINPNEKCFVSQFGFENSRMILNEQKYLTWQNFHLQKLEKPKYQSLYRLINTDKEKENKKIKKEVKRLIYEQKKAFFGVNICCKETDYRFLPGSIQINEKSWSIIISKKKEKNSRSETKRKTKKQEKRDKHRKAKKEKKKLKLENDDDEEEEVESIIEQTLNLEYNIVFHPNSYLFLIYNKDYSVIFSTDTIKKRNLIASTFLSFLEQNNNNNKHKSQDLDFDKILPYKYFWTNFDSNNIDGYKTKIPTLKKLLKSNYTISDALKKEIQIEKKMEECKYIVDLFNSFGKISGKATIYLYPSYYEIYLDSPDLNESVNITRRYNFFTKFISHPNEKLLGQFVIDEKSYLTIRFISNEQKVSFNLNMENYNNKSNSNGNGNSNNELEEKETKANGYSTFNFNCKIISRENKLISSKICLHKDKIFLYTKRNKLIIYYSSIPQLLIKDFDHFQFILKIGFNKEITIQMENLFDLIKLFRLESKTRNLITDNSIFNKKRIFKANILVNYKNVGNCYINITNNQIYFMKNDDNKNDQENLNNIKNIEKIVKIKENENNKKKQNEKKKRIERERKRKEKESGKGKGKGKRRGKGKRKSNKKKNPKNQKTDKHKKNEKKQSQEKQKDKNKKNAKHDVIVEDIENEFYFDLQSLKTYQYLSEPHKLSLIFLNGNIINFEFQTSKQCQVFIKSIENKVKSTSIGDGVKKQPRKEYLTFNITFKFEHNKNTIDGKLNLNQEKIIFSFEQLIQDKILSISQTKISNSKMVGNLSKITRTKKNNKKQKIFCYFENDGKREEFTKAFSYFKSNINYFKQNLVESIIDKAMPNKQSKVGVFSVELLNSNYEVIQTNIHLIIEPDHLTVELFNERFLIDFNNKKMPFVKVQFLKRHRNVLLLQLQRKEYIFNFRSQKSKIAFTGLLKKYLWQILSKRKFLKENTAQLNTDDSDNEDEKMKKKKKRGKNKDDNLNKDAMIKNNGMNDKYYYWDIEIISENKDCDGKGLVSIQKDNLIIVEPHRKNSNIIQTPISQKLKINSTEEDNRILFLQSPSLEKIFIFFENEFECAFFQYFITKRINQSKKKSVTKRVLNKKGFKSSSFSSSDSDSSNKDDDEKDDKDDDEEEDSRDDDDDDDDEDDVDVDDDDDDDDDEENLKSESNSEKSDNKSSSGDHEDTTSESSKF